jgi:Mg/Co/Ni transporter MgtE
MRKNKAENKKDEVHAIKKEDKVRLILFSVAMIAYLALLQTVGFLIMTMALIFGLIKIIGYKKNWIAIIAAVAITLLVMFVFGELFNVALPRGTGIFSELSRFIY